jgi:hypothetical protein
VKTTLPLFTEAGAERCVYVKRQHADGTMVDLEKLRDITLEPGERLIILVMNTDDLLILYTDSARTEIDAFEKLLNQSFEATPRAPVDQYLGMHVTRNRAQRLLALDGRRHVITTSTRWATIPHPLPPSLLPLTPISSTVKRIVPPKLTSTSAPKYGPPMVNSST